jgi:hypothetical protein
MIEYKRINKSESVRGLRLTTDNQGFEHGSAKFKGKTFDVVLDEEHIKRVTFGFHESSGLVAVMSEILKVDKEEPKGDFIDHILNQAAYENGWD